MTRSRSTFIRTGTQTVVTVGRGKTLHAHYEGSRDAVLCGKTAGDNKGMVTAAGTGQPTCKSCVKVQAAEMVAAFTEAEKLSAEYVAPAGTAVDVPAVGTPVELVTKSGIQYVGTVSQLDDFIVTVSLAGESTDVTVSRDRVASVDALGGPAGRSPDPVIGAPAARGFKVGDRVFGGVWGRPQHEYRVREISETGSLRLQVVGGPGLPLWISPATAVAWAEREAERDASARVVEVADGHVVHACCGKLNNAPHKNFCPKYRPPVPVVITHRYAIAAAHSAAMTEDAYRGCRVYGMGARPRVDAPAQVDGPVVRDETPAATVAGYTVHAFHRRLRGDMASAVGACGGQGWRGSAALVNCVDCLTGEAAGLNIGHSFVEAGGVLPGEGLCQQAMPAGDLCGERVTASIHVGGERVVPQPPPAGPDRFDSMSTPELARYAREHYSSMGRLTQRSQLLRALRAMDDGRQPPPVVGVVEPSPTVPTLAYGEQYVIGLWEVDVTDEADVAIGRAEDAFTTWRVVRAIKAGAGESGRVPEGWLLTVFSAAELATAVASGFVRRQGGFAYLLNQDGSLAVQPYVQAPACRPVVAARLGRNSASAQWGQQDELLGKLRRLASDASVAVDAVYYGAVGRAVQPHAELPAGFRRAEIGGPGTIYPL